MTSGLSTFASGAGVVGTLLLNEVAPRPHNSGHYTIEACHTSQFEQHLRAICGLPLGDPSMRVGAAVMINVLGQIPKGKSNDEVTPAERREATLAPMNVALGMKNGSPAIHWYGKGGEMKLGRKLGHVTCCADTEAEVDQLAAPILIAAGHEAQSPSVGGGLGIMCCSTESASDTPVTI
eukprot:SAG31_NODE_3108_length_4666_cov_2.823336_2_plen_179_part_00